MTIPEPAASRTTLTRTAALVWGLVGIGLIVRGALWLAGIKSSLIWILPSAVLLGALKGWFIFRALARRNIERITQLSPHKEKICIFAFQAMQSYLLILAMIAVGILLRLSPLPREYLSLLYLAIGLGLVVGSVAYWRG